MKTINKFRISVFILIALAGCSKSERPKTQTPLQEPNRIVLTANQMREMVVETVKEMPVAEEFSAVGEVSFDENNVVRIFPIVSGTVDNVAVSLGDYVQRGQLLASLLSTDISTFQRDYNVAKEDFEVADKCNQYEDRNAKLIDGSQKRITPKPRRNMQMRIRILKKRNKSWNCMVDLQIAWMPCSACWHLDQAISLSGTSMRELRSGLITTPTFLPFQI